jgi:O-succinylbenzoic acid--CoA ligase
MRTLVALDLAGGPAFVRALQRAWDDGDAVLPLDQRFSDSARASLARTMGAGAVVHASGRTVLDDGLGTEAGDALVVATSGSTGEPKGVVLTHDAVAASADATNARLAVTDDDHWLACLPLAHVGGLSVVTRALRRAVALTVLPRFDADDVTHAARNGATLTSLVATAMARIDPSMFRCIVLGGGRPPAIRPPNTVTTYGLTETGSGVVYDGVPLDGVHVRIADDGEILLRCPMMLRAYRNGSSPIDENGWLHTDDLGHWLDDGRLHVDGRRGELIISGGENVWPEQVEAVLALHPLVRDVGVNGLADPEWGEVVVAWVVPHDRNHPPSIDDLRGFLRERLPSFMAPRRTFIVAEIPRTNLGKLRRAALPSLDVLDTGTH